MPFPPIGATWRIDSQEAGGSFKPFMMSGAGPGRKQVRPRLSVLRRGIGEVATFEGRTTAHYLAERVERFPVRLTQLAHGLPVGGELDSLDQGTLVQALRARRPAA